MSEFNQYRREYTLGSLEEGDLDPNPMSLFKTWLNVAVESNIPDPNAMTVATVNAKGQPSQRIVLLKDLTDEGFVFYTNLGSRKAKELSENPNVSLHFPWHMLERQVRINGVATPLSRTAVAKYFFSRPKDSQLGAIVSKQSQPISSRQMLLTQFQQLKDKYAQGEIPLPDFWGGFLVKPEQIEFWQGGEHRLHDRFEYTKQADATWHIQRLNP
ncbi:pyridoxamine 5'-phosphate oxidase [Glaciecola sp. HTCC2999]|jgi:pyridoxamine 5'-phosphate oxidase|uniref:pyridoxamine 5'-phosphate oxidase n=1 Tax=Glaciecola sp. HTCC2999 TaxID=455436 RepID=UPI0000E0E141|nr:pyridoxamine 5'-phosphate oxidase [Glaciecola sp. HTCC2999]MCH1414429.1 pyridoxamine 5'-phosphate oxidase [Glaciecola sp.]